MEHNLFQETVWGYYQGYGRSLPWREPDANGMFDPYKILVSEIMLQQTQAPRVIPKYEQFLEHFPNIQTLAVASQQDVLTAWSGLGYNRRARFLHQAAQAVAAQHDGVVPGNEKDLVALPGVGTNTARAVLTYAFNQPVVFIETNIRTVYIHHFFQDKDAVPDTDIMELVQHTVDKEHPREWYWALMDYGSHLKTTVGNFSRYSKHYTKQSKFTGSRRQIRGAVIKLLTNKPLLLTDIQMNIPDERLESVLADLVKEGMIIKSGNRYRL
jgi:A/G-specific adenine glycosylase